MLSKDNFNFMELLLSLLSSKCDFLIKCNFTFYLPTQHMFIEHLLFARLPSMEKHEESDTAPSRNCLSQLYCYIKIKNDMI